MTPFRIFTSCLGFAGGLWLALGLGAELLPHATISDVVLIAFSAAFLGFIYGARA